MVGDARSTTIAREEDPGAARRKRPALLIRDLTVDDDTGLPAVDR